MDFHFHFNGNEIFKWINRNYKVYASFCYLFMRFSYLLLLLKLFKGHDYRKSVQWFGIEPCQKTVANKRKCEIRWKHDIVRQKARVIERASEGDRREWEKKWNNSKRETKKLKEIKQENVQIKSVKYSRLFHVSCASKLMMCFKQFMKTN